MSDWLTFHYPHRYPDDIPWHIYLQTQYISAADDIQIGDRAFFYEYKDNPERPRLRYLTGRQGIVRIATVNGLPYQRDAIIGYGDGESKDWGWGIPCDEGDTEGFVSQSELLQVLGFDEKYRFRRAKGLMRLHPEQGRKLLELFKR